MNTAGTTARHALASFDRKRVDDVALKAFFNLAAEWGLTADEQGVLLGHPSRRTFYRWRKGQVAALPADTLERISVLLGIYKALAILLPIKERAASWVKRDNIAFGGRSALDVMRQGRVDDLYQVRRHLDAWRGG
ncbi:MAG: MbcA/ParS/Xre antitoxin family protein [Steroidobacteraceae bacterium]|nr:MbcA/ParS/Xre antitoxin family protein [Steroidobacteraceae bacterium]